MSDFVLLLTLENYQTWMLTRGRFELFYEDLPRLHPIFVSEDLLTADPEFTDDAFHYMVRRGETELYRNEKNANGPGSCPVDFFRAWEDHWILQIEGIDLIDGQPLGAELGYQAAFNWHLIDGKPIYLFERNGSFGVSYDGQELPLRYDHIVRWECLFGHPFFTFGAHGQDGLITFFAQNDGRWHFVYIR